MTNLTAEDKQFQTEQDVRTLVESDKLRKDGTRMKRAMAEAKKQIEALRKAQK